MLDVAVILPHRIIMLLDIEITFTSNVSGLVKDWRGEIVKKKCTIIISSLDGSQVYGQTESNATSGTYSVDVGLASGSDILITCFYEGLFRGQLNLAGSVIGVTG